MVEQHKQVTYRFLYFVKGTRNERKILATTRHADFQKFQPGITVRISRSIKRPQSDEEDKVRFVWNRICV